MNIDESRLMVYLQSLADDEDEFLKKLRESAQADGVPIIRREMEELMRFFLRVQSPKKVLEIGAAVGYSAIMMAKALPDTSHITTIESYEKRIKAAKQNIKEAGLASRITLLEGDAGAFLQKLTGQFDLIFLDAAKAQYITWLPQILKLLSPGGVLITDNVLQEGDILESRFAVTRRNRTIHARMREYLYALYHTEGLSSAVLNVGDGVALSYRER